MTRRIGPIKRCHRSQPAFVGITGIFARSLLLLWTLAVAVDDVSAAPREVPEELAWVGVFNWELLGWLNNTNVMNELCPQVVGTEAARECRESYSQTRLLVIPVYAAAQRESARVGELVLLAEPGRELQIHAANRGVAKSFTPDLFLAD